MSAACAEVRDTRTRPDLQAGSPLGAWAPKVGVDDLHGRDYSQAELRGQGERYGRQRRDRGPRRLMLLGSPGTHAQAARRDRHAARLDGRGHSQSDRRQPRHPRGGGRNRLRPGADLVPRHPRVLLPMSMRPACSPARSSPRSSPPARSGRPRTRISTTCRNTPTPDMPFPATGLEAAASRNRVLTRGYSAASA